MVDRGVRVAGGGYGAGRHVLAVADEKGTSGTAREIGVAALDGDHVARPVR